MSPKTPPSGSGQQYIMPTDQAYARYKWRVPPTYPPGSSIKEVGRDEQQRWALHLEGSPALYISSESGFLVLALIAIYHQSVFYNTKGPRKTDDDEIIGSSRSFWGTVRRRSRLKQILVRVHCGHLAEPEG